MFWGVTLDSQKRYSQITEHAYHISMAVLEPRRKGTESSDKYVSLKLEHKNAEYLLCTLQYGKVMQVNLDIVFSKGEHTCFSLNGEGTVHLSGYYIVDEDDDDATPMALYDISSDYSKQDSLPVSSKYAKANKRSSGDDDDSEEDESGSEVDSDSVLVGSDDDDVKDVTPTVTLQKNAKNQDTKKKNVVSPEESKRKNELQKGNKAKKLKAESSTVVEILPKKSAKPASDALEARKEVQTNNVKEDSDDEDDDNEDDDGDDEESDEEEVTLDKQNDGDSHDVEEEKEDDDSDDEDSDDSVNDENDSSIGRTPMPKSKKKSAQVSKSIEVPSKKSPTKMYKKSKGIAEASKKNNLSIPTLIPNPINSKNVNSSTPKNAPAAKINVSGVQIEDLRVGSGPPAKNGRFVSIHYVGKLTNGKKFDSNEAPKKPFSFRLGTGEVIKGFDIGVSGMKVGGKRKITIPAHLGYGKQKTADIPANSTLIFVLDLVAVN